MDLSWVLRALEVAGLSGIRPSWVLVATAAAGALGYVTFPEGLGWLASWPGAGALLVFAIIEHFAERDTDMLQIFGAVQLGLSATTAILSTGAIARAERELAVGVPVWAVQAAAVVIALATIGVRRQLKLKVMQLSANATTPSRWIARAEEGGLVAGGALVVLSPLILAGVFVACALGGAGLLLAYKALDRRGRRACDGCGALARKEAQRCPKCHRPLEPEETLTVPAKLSERIAAVAQREPTAG